MKRRDLILGSGAALATTPLFPSMARASVLVQTAKFIFVFCYGGGTQRCILSHIGNDDVIDRESDSDTALRLIPYVSTSRTVVNDFFDTYHNNMLLFNGLEVRNIDHWIVQSSKTVSGVIYQIEAPSSPKKSNRLHYPHFVMGGPVFSGPFELCGVE